MNPLSSFFDIGRSWPPLGHFPPAAPRPHALQAPHTCRTFTLRLSLCHLDGAEGWTAQQVGVESVLGICRDQQPPWSGQQFPTGRRCRSRSARLRRSSRRVLGSTERLGTDCLATQSVWPSPIHVTLSLHQSAASEKSLFIFLHYSFAGFICLFFHSKWMREIFPVGLK